MIRNGADSWGVVAKGFHWLMAALILVQIVLGVLAANSPMSPAKIELFVWHKSLGMLLLALVALRVLWRLTDTPPPLPAELPAWERMAARGGHLLLYALMIALPVTGWVVNSAANVPFRIFWLLPLPAIVAPDETTAELFAGLHDGLAAALVLVLVAHVGAALRHHFIKRNRVLMRMLPAIALLWLCGLLMLAPQSAIAADWKTDSAGSKLEFVITFEKTPAAGVFKEFDARLRFDPEQPAGGSLDVIVKVTSADMNIADVNKEIRGKDWFDYAGFPQAEFHSTDLRRVEGNRYVAHGSLSLKGVKQAVQVPFALSESAGGAVMEGELTLQRGAFGIGTGAWAATNVIGADVKVKFRVKLLKAG